MYKQLSQIGNTITQSRKKIGDLIKNNLQWIKKFLNYNEVVIVVKLSTSQICSCFLSLKKDRNLFIN